MTTIVSSWVKSFCHEFLHCGNGVWHITVWFDRHLVHWTMGTWDDSSTCCCCDDVVPTHRCLKRVLSEWTSYSYTRQCLVHTGAHWKCVQDYWTTPYALECTQGSENCHDSSKLMDTFLLPGLSGGSVSCRQSWMTGRWLHNQNVTLQGY